MSSKIPRRLLSKMVLGTAFTFSTYIVAHANPSDIEKGTPGINGTNGITDGASGTNGTPGGQATAVASDTLGIQATATGGKGGTGGNGNSTITASKAGNAGAGANGGDASASGTLLLSSSPGQINVAVLASGGAGGDAGTPGAASRTSTAGDAAIAGNGGNATATASAMNNSADLISIDVEAFGGAGGNQPVAGAAGGSGGNASLSNVFASSNSGNITIHAIANGGNSSTVGGNAFLSNAVDASTTGNITLMQEAFGGTGTTGGTGYSSLTLARYNAASITTTVWASGATPNAYLNLAGTNNVTGFADTLGSGGNATIIVATSSVGAATAHTFSTVGVNTGSAILNGSNIFFPSYNTYVTGVSVPGAQDLTAASNRSSLSTGANQSLSDAVFGNFHISNGTTFRVNDSLVQPYLAARNSSANGTQTHSEGFEGMLNTSLFIPEDLVIIGLPDGSISDPTFDLLRFRVWIDGQDVIDISYNSPTALANSLFGIGRYDLGPLLSFGSGPLDLKIQMDLTTHLTTQKAGIYFTVYNQDPTINFTPEPASLSLLIAATLPLLLKRRRKN